MESVVLVTKATPGNHGIDYVDETGHFPLQELSKQPMLFHIGDMTN